MSLGWLPIFRQICDVDAWRFEVLMHSFAWMLKSWWHNAECHSGLPPCFLRTSHNHTCKSITMSKQYEYTWAQSGPSCLASMFSCSPPTLGTHKATWTGHYLELLWIIILKLHPSNWLVLVVKVPLIRHGPNKDLFGCLMLAYFFGLTKHHVYSQNDDIWYDHDDDGADEDDHASNQMHHDDNHDS